MRRAGASRYEPQRSRKLQVASLSPPARSPARMTRRSSNVPTTRPTARLAGYVYRRPLTGRELLPAIGVGFAAGFAAFYVARLFLERTPLLPEERRLGKHHASGAEPRTA